MFYINADRENRSLFYVGDFDHAVQDRLKGHRMAAPATSLEKIAGTLPIALKISHGVKVIRPFKGDLELIEFDPVAFLGIAFGLFDFADHSVVHSALFLSIVRDTKKSTRDASLRAL
jgi:hypothetical protein